MFGVSTDIMLQSIMIFPSAFLIGAYTDLSVFVQALPIMLLNTVGLTFSSLVKSFEGFGLVQTFINLPIFFLNGALFLLSNVPQWLLWISHSNPLTYGVDALRTVMMGGHAPLLPMYVNIGVLRASDAVMFTIGIYAFLGRNNHQLLLTLVGGSSTRDPEFIPPTSADDDRSPWPPQRPRQNGDLLIAEK